MYNNLTEDLLISYVSCGNSFANSHLKSYNNVIKNDLSNIIKQFNPITHVSQDDPNGKKLIVTIEFDNISIDHPHQIIDGRVAYIFPSHCRATKTSYTIKIKASYSFRIVSELNGISTTLLDYKTKDLLDLGSIPCMVGSELCNTYGLTKDQLQDQNEDKFEIGGYFIINGLEYMIIPQENKISNKIYKNIDTFMGITEHKVWGAFKVSDAYMYPYYTEVAIDKNDSIWISVSVSKKNKIRFPLSVFYRAMGVVTDKDIVDSIVLDSETDVSEFLSVSIDRKDPNLKYGTRKNKNRKIVYNGDKIPTSSEDILTQRDALLFIGNVYCNNTYSKKHDTVDKKIIFANNKLFNEELFPQIGTIEKLPEKILLLSKMVRSCIRLKLGLEEVTDSLNYGNKDIITSGILFGQLIRYVYNNEVIGGASGIKKTLKMQMKEYSNTKNYENYMRDNFNSRKFDKLDRHISSGEWPAGRVKGFNTKAGVSSLLERKSRLDTIAYTQKIVITSKKKGKDDRTPDSVRKLHQSLWAYIDAYDTPDSSSGIGKQKYKTIFSDISIASDSNVLILYINSLMNSMAIHECKNILPNKLIGLSKILINGYMKYCVQFELLRDVYDELVSARRKGQINRYTSIELDFNEWEIRIYTTSGRFIRPVFVVDQSTQKTLFTVEHYNKLHKGFIDWNWLVDNGIIEYVNISEEMNSLRIAFSFDDLNRGNNIYTHCELCDISVLSVTVLSSPLVNRMQGPRVTFGCSLCKQAVGIFSPNHYWRMDTDGYVLCGGQKPLVSSLAEKITNMAEMPGGHNAMVAITTFSGFNIEDSTIANNQSKEYGLFDAFIYKVKSDMLTTDKERFGLRDPNNTKFHKGIDKYHAIGKDGMPIVGKVVNYGDVLISKVRLINKSEVESSFNKMEYEDKSKVYKEIMPGTVERVMQSWNSAQHLIIQVKIRILKKYEVGDKVATQCYSNDTKVSTLRGWLSFKEITLNDCVLSLNLSTKKTQYNCIDAIYSYSGIGKKMVHFKNKYIDMLVTDNHRMVFKETNSKDYILRKARDIVGMSGSFLNLDGDYSIEKNESTVIENYNKMVYCCSTKWSTLYVSRNGHSMFSGNSSQKGTNSLLFNASDFPRTEQGLIPDIIFNPHGFVTRMTVPLPITMALGLIAIDKGIRIDGTPFNKISIDSDIIDVMKERKIEGMVPMINGVTGRYMDVPIFVAPLHYQRLKNMVAEKVSSRETGFCSPNTRQPVKGKKRNGGFKLGVMEFQAIAAHGSQEIMREKSYNHSDGFVVYVSDDTGEICIGNEDEHIFKDGCGDTRISRVEIPFVFMIVKYLVSVMGIKMKLVLEND